MFKELGNTCTDKGDLITLYLEDNQGSTVTVVLIAAAKLNLSMEMANYYELIKGHPHWLITDNAMNGFAEYLVEKKLAYEPKSTSLKLGEKNRPSRRIVDEYKYKLNPKAFAVKIFEERLNDSCAGFYTNSGLHINLTGSSFCPMEARLQMVQDNEEVGTIRVGIIPDSNIRGIDELEPEKEAIKSFIQRQLDRQFAKDNVKIKDINLYAA